MIAEKIKEIRTRQGFSQEKLAEKTNLSLRTIQRVENGNTDPHGNTIIRIADALNVPIDSLLESQKKVNKTYLASLHISALSFLLFPLLGIIIPLIFWMSKKDQVKSLTTHAKKLLSFQITWTFLLFMGLIGLFFWTNYKMGATNTISPSLVREIYFPFYLYVGGLYLYNLMIITFNVYRVNVGKKAWYKPKINFLP